MSLLSSRQICIILSFSSFILSGSMIFSPLHKSDNIIVSVISAFIFGILGLAVVLFCFQSKSKKQNTEKSHSKTVSIIAYILSCTSCLMMITEMIKDVAYVANRGISLLYYFLLLAATLIVSLHLCLSSSKGIFRFSILMFIPFLFLYFASVSGFISSKSFVFDIVFGNKKQVFSSLLLGALTGIYFTLDSALYIFCFKKYVFDSYSRLLWRPIVFAYVSAFFTIAFYNLSTSFIFGSTLTKSINDPDYALAKLLHGIDLTEMISALRIISFIIKSSIYIFCSSSAIKKAFGKKSTVPFILFQYILIPSVVIILSIIDKNLGYGEFQHLTYPVVILLSLTFLIQARHKKRE